MLKTEISIHIATYYCKIKIYQVKKTVKSFKCGFILLNKIQFQVLKKFCDEEPIMSYRSL